MEHLINEYERELNCEYRGEFYKVRDNGAILRLKREGKRKRPLDEKWTFGTPNKQKGYFNFANETTHRIVATAFLGPQPSSQHVVDHIDTNKKNNRPENLRWLTRLENIILNPITQKRIILSYGSVEAFLADPTNPKYKNLEQDFDWMRTVTISEAENTKKNLLKWAKESTVPRGNPFTESIHKNQKEIGIDRLETVYLVQSITEGAFQKNWNAESEFPLCPKINLNTTIHVYHDLLKKDKTFFQNTYYKTVILKYSKIEEESALLVLYRILKKQSKDERFGIIKIEFADEMFIHEIITNYNGTLEHYWEVDAENHFQSIINGTKWTPKFDSQGKEYKDDYMPF